jgi:hypothetical protein
MAEQQKCKHCKRDFDSAQGLKMHEPQCDKRLPIVYRIAAPLARSKIQDLAFDRRTHEGRVFEYAVLRFYVDRLELWGAALVLVGRTYLMFPWSEWTGLSLVGAGAIEPSPSDIALLFLMVSTILSRRELIQDYKQHVVDRLEKISKRT